MDIKSDAIMKRKGTCGSYLELLGEPSDGYPDNEEHKGLKHVFTGLFRRDGTDLRTTYHKLTTNDAGICIEEHPENN